MVQLVAAALILWAVTSGLRWASKAKPEAVAAGVKRLGGGLLLALALFVLVARGNVEASAPLAALGLWLMGWGAGLRSFSGWPFQSKGAGGAQRTLRERTLELQVDDASGAADGRVLEGRFRGRRLSELDEDDCTALREFCRGVDPGGARLLDFYIDRRFTRRRSAEEGDADSGRGSRFGARAMTENDAYQMLGLAKGASREEIAKAHRMLMKKVHPDHGGTASLAALLNEAKDVLTRRHH